MKNSILGLILCSSLAFSSNAKSDDELINLNAGGAGSLTTGTNTGASTNITGGIDLMQYRYDNHSFIQLSGNVLADNSRENSNLTSFNLSLSNGEITSYQNGVAQSFGGGIGIGLKNSIFSSSGSFNYRNDNFNTNTYFGAKLSMQIPNSPEIQDTGVSIGVDLKQQIVKGLNLMLDGNLLVSSEGNLSGDLSAALKLNLSDSGLVKNLPVYIKAGAMAEHSSDNKTKNAQLSLGVGMEYNQNLREASKIAASAN